MKNTILTIGMAITTLLHGWSQRYVGGDISLLPEYEEAGAEYKTQEGTEIADLLPWLHEEGMNAMRVRLFVNPQDHKTKYPTKYDPNACQDLEYITPLCKRIIDNGFKLMLDFHYSDTWADPAKQWIPESWRGLSDEQLYKKIYDYTKETLASLKAEGITPAFIQPGNEISYGMLWGMEDDSASSLKKTFMGSDANWVRFGKLLNQAIKACREECPEAKIVLHTERVAQQNVLTNFYDEMKKLGVDYDIIGLSYYPYFHGDMNVLDKALSTLQGRYPEKKIMIVETGYSYKWEVPGTTHDFTNKWTYSEEGQNQFAKDLVGTLEKYDTVDGLFWWWMEYNAFDTKLGGWYNAPLFNSLDGKATPALKTICSFGEDSGVNTIRVENQSAPEWYDLNGRRVNDPKAPGLKVSRKGKLLVR
ncbi:MAG: arabinogalactan endo-1,4-beta-galactosidase [Muribaculaceae bacterium]|nr:arabinogalactan endo-1,4-beta-galactosidase [Muribaculaceae bacterium]